MNHRTWNIYLIAFQKYLNRKIITRLFFKYHVIILLSHFKDKQQTYIKNILYCGPSGLFFVGQCFNNSIFTILEIRGPKFRGGLLWTTNCGLQMCSFQCPASLTRTRMTCCRQSSAWSLLRAPHCDHPSFPNQWPSHYPRCLRHTGPSPRTGPPRRACHVLY